VHPRTSQGPDDVNALLLLTVGFELIRADARLQGELWLLSEADGSPEPEPISDADGEVTFEV
jgi:hypothetical protein